MNLLPKLFISSFMMLTLLITACVSRPTTPVEINNMQHREQLSAITQWSVKGRIGIKTADDGFTSNLNWQHQPDKQYFRIYGSLGQTYAELRQNNQLTVLELPDDKIYESSNAEAMIQDVLGYSLPIEHLQYWILGLPYPGGENDLTFDEQGFLRQIKYQQWHISYSKFKQFTDFGDLYLPGKIKVTDDQVTLRLSLRNWSRYIK